MKRLRLVNVYLDLGTESDYFTVDKYKIYPSNGHIISAKNFKRHTQNAIALFEGSQPDSILYSGGRTIYRGIQRKRKLIEDIMVVGSILTGWNWDLYSKIKFPQFPLTPNPYLENIEMSGKTEIENNFQKIIKKIKEPGWQIQYENGFHIRMLLHHANITNMESRFLSNIVTWEWLYPHLKNPDGATPDDESNNLKTIIDYILKYFWPSKKFEGNNIFHALRNQLAHSGKLPINRPKDYVAEWMTKLDWETHASETGIRHYLSFFDKLTQIIVLKTLDIHAEKIIQPDLDKFLNIGKL